MLKYELLAVLPGTLTETEATTRSNELADFVKTYGSEVEVHPLGKNRLAYPIKQIRYGYFYTLVFQSERAAVRELTAKLALARDLLRAMVSHFNTTLTTAQKIMYTTNELGVTTMLERGAAPAPASAAAAGLIESAGSAPVASRVERKIEELDLADINKKLDDIMSGEIIPGI